MMKNRPFFFLTIDLKRTGNRGKIIKVAQWGV